MLWLDDDWQDDAHFFLVAWSAEQRLVINRNKCCKTLSLEYSSKPMNKPLSSSSIEWLFTHHSLLPLQVLFPLPMLARPVNSFTSGNSLFLSFAVFLKTRNRYLIVHFPNFPGEQHLMLIHSENAWALIYDITAIFLLPFQSIVDKIRFLYSTCHA